MLRGRASRIPIGGKEMFVTLAGVDNSTDLDELAALSGRFPFVEWAVLYAGDEAETPRFARRELLASIADFCRHHAAPAFALHLCGRGSAALLEELADFRGVPIAPYARIQVSFREKPPAIERALERAMRAHPDVTFVVQYNPTFGVWWRGLPDQDSLHVLADASLGRGMLPSTWTRPSDIRNVSGFAGGLGPGTLAGELPRILHAAGPVFWIDMESGLRDHTDRFDLDRARRCIDIVARAARQMSDDL